MDLLFFPKNKTFWKYHFLGISIFTIYQAFIIISIYPQKTFNTLASVLWLILVTLGVLTIRFNYIKRQWHKISISSQIFRTILLSFLLAPSITLTILLTLLPFFHEAIFTELLLEKYNTTKTQYLLWLFLSNSLSVVLVLNLWTFIYIGITTNKRMQESALNTLRLENSLKEARLANLTNQLNPHFLFNSLNNIRFKIHENAQQADKMITALSEILRYSLESSRKEKVTLEEEISITNSYVDIMKLQLEDRLDYQQEIELDYFNYLIPPMLLQLLVENAIKHGIENIKEKSTLTISCFGKDNHIILAASNPIPSNQDIAEKTQENIGIGLKNIQERLQLLYNQAASIETSNKNNQFCVKISIPKETLQ